jgi:hypothetical protein
MLRGQRPVPVRRSDLVFVSRWFPRGRGDVQLPWLSRAARGCCGLGGRQRSRLLRLGGEIIGEERLLWFRRRDWWRDG